MSKKDEYDQYIVKVPRFDKEGKDVSELEPRQGGRRRDNGRLAALAYDFEEYDSDSYVNRDELEYEIRQQVEEQYASEREAERHSQEIEETTEFLTDIALLLICELLEHPEIISAIGHSIKEGAIKVKDKIQMGVSHVTAKVKDKKTEKKPQKAIQVSKKKTRKGTIVAAKDSSVSDDINQDKSHESDESTINMTIEEAREEYIQLFMDYLSMRARAYRLSHAHIIDGDLSINTDQYLTLMNSLVEKYPALLDKTVQNKLFDILEQNKGQLEQLELLSSINLDVNGLSQESKG